VISIMGKCFNSQSVGTCISKWTMVPPITQGINPSSHWMPRFWLKSKGFQKYKAD
jgi:hypothetical protein